MTIPYADMELHPEEDEPRRLPARSPMALLYVALAVVGLVLGAAVWWVWLR